MVAYMFASAELHFTQCKMETTAGLAHQHLLCVEVDFDADRDSCDLLALHLVALQQLLQICSFDPDIKSQTSKTSGAE